MDTLIIQINKTTKLGCKRKTGFHKKNYYLGILVKL